MTKGVMPRYLALTASGDLAGDPAQAAAVAELARLEKALGHYDPDWRRGIVSVLMGKTGTPPRGLYLHGGVGRGKTMLMDLFFDTVRFRPKQRIHFHAFMHDIHRRIAQVRHAELNDPVRLVAGAIATDARLLCLDELHVTDITDAMILSRLFDGLFDAGVVVVATSNSAPDGLYKDGLNRQLFLPFIRNLKEHVVVHELAAAKDYRQDKLIGQSLWLTPVGMQSSAALNRMFLDLTGVPVGDAEPTRLDVGGRTVSLGKTAKGVALVPFADLCAQPLGASDYLAVARAFHTILMFGIPRLGPENRNEARRFITLIDVLYDARTRLAVSADAEPDQLYVAGDGHALFERTASRLVEMRSAAYLRRAAVEHDGDALDHA